MSGVVPDWDIVDTIAAVAEPLLSITRNQCLGLLVVSKIDYTVRAHDIVEEADVCSDYFGYGTV